MEVSKQVGNALNVTTREFGKTEKEKRGMVQFRDLSVGNVDVGLANRQFYQLIGAITVSVKCALS